MRNRFCMTLLFFVLISMTASAQMADNVEIDRIKNDYLGIKPAGKPFSLIDFSKLQWNHSYSIGFFSGGGVSGSSGLYVGNIFYEFSQSLTLNLRLGIAHDPASIFDRSKGQNASFLPGIHLNYQPSPNFTISAGFDTYPQNQYYLYNPYSNYRRIR